MELSFGTHQMGRILASLSILPFPLHPQGRELRSGFPEFRALPPPLSFRLGSRRGLEPLNLKAKQRAARSEHLSPWDDKPYELFPGGKKVYLDEQDVLSFLDPPKELIPLDPTSYNPAAYLWKKIGDIPEERRHNLLRTVKGGLISRLWELAGTRYQDAKFVKLSASPLLSLGNNSKALEIWNCRASEGGLPVGWFHDFKKAIFFGKDGHTYGRIVTGVLFSFGLKKFRAPLYFKVRGVMEVMSTEQPCDIAYDFGDGLLDPLIIPPRFPKPAEHPWPFNDHLVIYLRHAGPGVVVGQAWQEGKDLEQVPKKLYGEILMVKDFYATGEEEENTNSN
ncbi:uncharacterized protein LOC122027407 isoform X2 [Zingiber officinale]|uniref:uncharacterized protein LOC122027407 isoform X2 n=1 Tax=Zingiber officinale TaxID=94328 RepID=UPI001C4BD98C|nr:uncharacterized protein LOC122027407 isoform X2 [Zingiber officinale]